ncbi:MAG: hypothetical protein CM15mV41_1310 [Caudoviricetes sp.]|nr:MAG: hypothetical protein CM15mV41_1310 [Caudoviricetes sp.]
MIGRATSFDAGSVLRGYVLLDVLPSIAHVKVNALSLILILFFSIVIALARAETKVCVVVLEDTPTLTVKVSVVAFATFNHLPAIGSVERG